MPSLQAATSASASETLKLSTTVSAGCNNEERNAHILHSPVVPDALLPARALPKHSATWYQMHDIEGLLLVNSDAGRGLCSPSATSDPGLAIEVLLSSPELGYANLTAGRDHLKAQQPGAHTHGSLVHLPLDWAGHNLPRLAELHQFISQQFKGAVKEGSGWYITCGWKEQGAVHQALTTDAAWQGLLAQWRAKAQQGLLSASNPLQVRVHLGSTPAQLQQQADKAITSSASWQSNGLGSNAPCTPVLGTTDNMAAAPFGNGHLPARHALHQQGNSHSDHQLPGSFLLADPVPSGSLPDDTTPPSRRSVALPATPLSQPTPPMMQAPAAADSFWDPQHAPHTHQSLMDLHPPHQVPLSTLQAAPGTYSHTNAALRAQHELPPIRTLSASRLSAPQLPAQQGSGGPTGEPLWGALGPLRTSMAAAGQSTSRHSSLGPSRATSQGQGYDGLLGTSPAPNCGSASPYVYPSSVSPPPRHLTSNSAPQAAVGVRYDSSGQVVAMSNGQLTGAVGQLTASAPEDEGEGEEETEEGGGAAGAADGGTKKRGGRGGRQLKTRRSSVKGRESDTKYADGRKKDERAHEASMTSMVESCASTFGSLAHLVQVADYKHIECLACTPPTKVKAYSAYHTACIRKHFVRHHMALLESSDADLSMFKEYKMSSRAPGVGKRAGSPESLLLGAPSRSLNPSASQVLDHPAAADETPTQRRAKRQAVSNISSAIAAELAAGPSRAVSASHSGMTSPRRVSFRGPATAAVDLGDTGTPQSNHRLSPFHDAAKLSRGGSVNFAPHKPSTAAVGDGCGTPAAWGPLQIDGLSVPGSGPHAADAWRAGSSGQMWGGGSAADVGSGAGNAPQVPPMQSPHWPAHSALNMSGRLPSVSHLGQPWLQSGSGGGASAPHSHSMPQLSGHDTLIDMHAHGGAHPMHPQPAVTMHHHGALLTQANGGAQRPASVPPAMHPNADAVLVHHGGGSGGGALDLRPLGPAGEQLDPGLSSPLVPGGFDSMDNQSMMDFLSSLKKSGDWREEVKAAQEAGEGAHELLFVQQAGHVAGRGCVPGAQGDIGGFSAGVPCAGYGVQQQYMGQGSIMSAGSLMRTLSQQRCTGGGGAAGASHMPPQGRTPSPALPPTLPHATTAAAAATWLHPMAAGVGDTGVRQGVSAAGSGLHSGSGAAWPGASSLTLDALPSFEPVHGTSGLPTLGGDSGLIESPLVPSLSPAALNNMDEMILGGPAHLGGAAPKPSNLGPLGPGGGVPAPGTRGINGSTSVAACAMENDDDDDDDVPKFGFCSDKLMNYSYAQLLQVEPELQVGLSEGGAPV